MKHNTAPLTDRRIRSLKAEGRKRVEAMDSMVAGLGVRVLPTGHKSWFLRYGPQEGRRRIVLGPYPDPHPGRRPEQGARAGGGLQDQQPGPHG